MVLPWVTDLLVEFESGTLNTSASSLVEGARHVVLLLFVQILWLP